MSNGARNRKISRTRPSREKRTHQRVHRARSVAIARMAAAAAEELGDEDVVVEGAPIVVRCVWGYGCGPKGTRTTFTERDVAAELEAAAKAHQPKQNRLKRFLRRGK